MYDDTINEAMADKAARRKEQEERDASQRAYEEWQAKEARKLQRQRREADWRMLLRILIAEVIAVGLGLAVDADLMNEDLAWVLFAVDTGWIFFWGGAWWHYRHGKGERIYGAE